MKDLTDNITNNISGNIKKAIVGLGFFLLTSASLSAQENPLRIKTGLAYNVVNTGDISKNCLGIESLAEKSLTESGKLFLELELGFYADTRSNQDYIYSKLQTNLGLRYRPLINNGWSLGGKAALGLSSEFYKQIESADNYEKVHFNKIAGLDLQKTFKKDNGVSISVSRELDRNVWIFGAKYLLKPSNNYYSKN